MRGLIIALIAVVAVAGCQRDNPVSTRETSWLTNLEGTGIGGDITLGPMCPGPVSLKNPCPDTPYAAPVRIENLDGSLAAEATSGADGRYMIALDPGKYRVVPMSAVDSGSPGDLRSSPFPRPPAAVVVSVPATGWAEVNLSYDTGIR
jgi:hypothetical protein